MRKCTVTCPDCKGQFNTEHVETLDISESPQGYDILTFTCPNCGDSKEAFVLGN